MATMRIPLAINSYQSRSLTLSAQRLVNLYPEVSPPDAKMPLVLFGTPGLKLFATCGSGPIRAMHNFSGTLCAVSDDDFYTITSAGTETNQGTVGSVTSSDVYMADNGSQLMIVAGPATDEAYMWNGAALASIVDVDYPGAETVAFIDGYHVITKPDTDEFYWSALRDCTSWDGADYATAEGDPDDLVGLFVDHREIWLFGKETTEIWYNDGSPFSRVSGAFIERGCAAKGTVAKADNSVFWLGDDGIVYRADGYAPLRISTHAIEYALGTSADLSIARAFTYAQEGHTFYVLTVSDVGTFVFDAATALWHERDSRNATDGESLGRWRADCGVFCYDKVLVGDYANGNIYELDLDTYTDNTTEITRVATSAPIHAQGKVASMSQLEIEIESGVGLTTGDGSDPQAVLDWSDDGGKTWSNELWTDMGAIGAYGQRAMWRKLGAFRQRVLRVTISDPVKVAIIAANAEVG